MELVKYNATMERAERSHNMTSNSNLFDCYERPSRNKFEAYEKCMSLYSKYQGKNYRINSFNIYGFTFSFYGIYEGKEAFFYITKDHNRVCFMEAE